MRSYWKRVFGLALLKTLSDIHVVGLGSAGLWIAGQFVAFFLLSKFGSPDATMDQLLSKVSWPLLVFGLFPILYLWNVVRTPADMYSEVVGRIGTLEQRLIPRFKLECSANDAVERLPIGSTVMSVAGKHQTTVRSYDSVVRVLCTNVSLSRLDGLEAYLVGLFERGDDGAYYDIGFRDSLPLCWSRNWQFVKNREPDGLSEYSKTLPQDTAAFFYVLKQWANFGVHIATNQSILEINNIFDKKKPFRAVVQVNAKDSIAERINVDISFDSDGRIVAQSSGSATTNPISQIRALPSLAADSLD